MKIGFDFDDFVLNGCLVFLGNDFLYFLSFGMFVLVEEFDCVGVGFGSDVGKVG